MEPSPTQPDTPIAPAAPSRTVDRYPGLTVAAFASIGAGAIHGAATGIHAEHPELARLFVVITVLQLGAGVWALVRPTRLAAVGVAAINVIAVGGWLATRLWGISWIDGLADREAAQFADTMCAALGAAAAGLAFAALLVGKRPASPVRMLVPAVVIAALAIPAMWTGGTHVHSHDEAAHDHPVAAGADGVATEDTVHSHDTTTEDTAHSHDTTTEDTTHTHDTTNGTVAEQLAVWPRAFDPAQPMDLSGVPGVTPEQEARAAQLIADTQRELPKWSTTAAAEADGYVSIGDAGTGAEHFMKIELIQDDVMLDPTQPESLVFNVAKDGTKTLAGAMFIASARPTDDPTLTSWAGPLMTWHNHGNLCWDMVNGKRTVVGLTDANGKCARGINTGGANPMVHVWITPNQCGPFAALEGVGAGQAAVSEQERTDKCQEHGDHAGHGTSTAADPKPYDPTQPIDLSGTPGVTPEQQAAAENLIAITLVRLPQWSDPKVAEAAGFHSIGDGATGEEHYINWDWINDKDWLNPDKPESLVYRPQPDGTKQLVSAMYMLPDTMSLDEVPNMGGALMQWHIHDNLCFTPDKVAPRVAGITSSNADCNPPLVKFKPSPMIHVWIVPHPCGPFAALEGVGAGQIKPGETRLCDHAHGSTGLLG